MLRCSATRAMTRTLHEPWPKHKRPPSARDPPSQSAAPQKTAESISRKPYDWPIRLSVGHPCLLSQSHPESALSLAVPLVPPVTPRRREGWSRDETKLGLHRSSAGQHAHPQKGPSLGRNSRGTPCARRALAK